VFKSFLKTMPNEDMRRPRMELGLGVWVGAASKYYAVSTIQEEGLIMDTVGGQSIAVYMETMSGVPSAIFTRGKKPELKDGIIKVGKLTYDGGLWKEGNNKRPKIERPLQMFTRWYGFSLTFRNTQIYGQ